MENQDSTLESYTSKMPPSGRLKRGDVVDISTGDDGDKKPAALPAFKKPKCMVQSKLVTTNPGEAGVGAMDVAIADFILSNGLPPSLSECPKLRVVIEKAKSVPATYKPPSRQLVAGPLLDANHSTISTVIEEQITKEADVFGATIFGDGATHFKIPYFNILGAGVHNDAGLIDIADCSGHVAKGYKKDAEYIAKLFIPHMEQLDPDKTRYVSNFP